MSAVLQAPAMDIRPMVEQDVDAVLPIEAQSYPFPWSRGIFEDCLRVGYSCWVAQLDDQVVGYGIVSAGAGEAHVLNICISKEYRGRGFGLAMLNRLINLARWHHSRAIFLEVRPTNYRAIDIYEQRGFGVVGRRPNYYPAKKGREDALIMAMTLFRDSPDAENE